MTLFVDPKHFIVIQTNLVDVSFLTSLWNKTYELCECELVCAGYQAMRFLNQYAPSLCEQIHCENLFVFKLPKVPKNLISNTSVIINNDDQFVNFLSKVERKETRNIDTLFLPMKFNIEEAKLFDVSWIENVNIVNNLSSFDLLTLMRTKLIDTLYISNFTELPENDNAGISANIKVKHLELETLNDQVYRYFDLFYIESIKFKYIDSKFVWSKLMTSMVNCKRIECPVNLLFVVMQCVNVDELIVNQVSEDVVTDQLSTIVKFRLLLNDRQRVGNFGVRLSNNNIIRDQFWSQIEADTLLFDSTSEETNNGITVSLLDTLPTSDSNYCLELCKDLNFQVLCIDEQDNGIMSD